MLPSLGAALYILPDIVQYPGGWRTALTLRQDLYAGRTIVIYALGAFNICWFLVFASSLILESIPPRQKQILLATWPLAAGLILLSGSRSELVTRNLLPLAILILARVPTREKKVAVIMLMLSGAALFFASYRAVVRDERSTRKIIEASSSLAILNGPLGYVLSGDEASAFDYLAAIRRQVPSPVPYRGTEALKGIVLAPIPSAMLSSKPVRGGEYATVSLRPDLHQRGGNLAISAFGDLYLIKGEGAIAIGAVLLGLTTSSLIGQARTYEVGSQHRYLDLYVASYLLACIVPIVRADLSEVGVGIVRISLLVALLRLSSLVGTSREMPLRGMCSTVPEAK
jgi:hypothetical protein